MDERKNRDFSTGPIWNSATNRWFVEIRYPDGSRSRKRFRREREALRVWSAEQTKIAEGRWKAAPSPSEELTFGDLLDRYEQHAKLHVPSFASYTAPALKVWKSGIPGSTPAAEVTPAIIDGVKLERAEKVKKCSVDRNLQVLRRVFNWAIEQGLATDNPVRRVKFFRADTRRLRYLTKDEYKLLLSEASKIYRSPLLREAIELAVNTGLRRGNLLSLRWEWIDWLSRVIRVPHTKSGKPHAVPLNATAHAILQRLWTKRGDSPFVFAHRNGENAGEALQSLKNGFQTALENAGIKDFRWHDLRQHAGFRIMPGSSRRQGRLTRRLSIWWLRTRHNPAVVFSPARWPGREKTCRFRSSRIATRFKHSVSSAHTSTRLPRISPHAATRRRRLSHS